ncbi:MAG: hypothetical protein J4452_00570 [Candidatus Aenigmarchaeota archaeon]|nr:hypothetical protein [Candidatus Aenigmarchaeota archaeon]
MGLKKFLAIPALIILYIYGVNYFISSGFAALSLGLLQNQENASSEGNVVNVSLGESAFVQVTRPYFFGLITLPVFMSTVGDISMYHNIFFAFIGFITVLFVLMEWRERRWRK